MVRTKAAVLQARCGPRSTSAAIVEVETPILQLTNGGAAARPFRTHLNAFDQEMLLRIALELDLKRAMIGGVDRVYEIGRTFRNEGLDSTHAAEFSMLEAYEAYGDYDTMAELTRTLVVERRARRSGAPSCTARDGSEIDLERRVARGHDPRPGLRGASARRSPRDVRAETLRELRRQARRRAAAATGVSGEIVLELYEKLVEHTLIQPDLRQGLSRGGAAAGEAAPRQRRAWSRRST